MKAGSNFHFNYFIRTILGKKSLFKEHEYSDLIRLIAFLLYFLLFFESLISYDCSLSFV